MSRFNQLSKTTLSSWRPLLILAAALVFAGCSDDDVRSTGSRGADFHGPDWATIKDLDPRGEQCVDCHGKQNDMAPMGGIAHNLGLKNFDTPEKLGVKDLTIDSATIIDGKVTFALSKALPAGATYNATFAKLAPRVRHDRGHDWQNYLNAASAPQGGIVGAVLEKGLAPQMASSNSGFLKLASDRKSLTFDMKGSDYNWGEHEFDVDYKSGSTGQTPGGSANFVVTGTKVKVEGISEHISCFEGHKDAIQLKLDNGLNNSNAAALLCWWPDGTSLPAGVFVTNDDYFVVSYEEAYTHRVSLLISGSPSFNTWFDFIPDGTQLNSESYSVETALQSTAAARDIVDIQSCNSCHDSLAMSPGVHGGFGSRSETQTCVTCHNPGNLQAETGRSVDFKQLIHRIHRGKNLPSINGTVTSTLELPNDKGGKGLLSGQATDWTNVRFPQGITPGNPEGITNCVKCHMGPETKRIVQEFSDEVGPGAGYDVPKELKLAKETAQGDNWLNVRNVEACRGCHDSQIWMNGRGDKDIMETAVPLYGSKYLNIGYDWIGVKGATKAKNETGAEAGFKHASRTLGSGSSFFTCGSGGGCHDNPDLDGYSVTPEGRRDPNILEMGDGTAGSARVHRVHLQLNRDFIIAERFEVQILDAMVDEDGFHSTIGLWDKKLKRFIQAGEVDIDSNLPGTVVFNLQAMFGWMKDGSPDYNHSTGAQGQPGAPTANVRFVGADHTPATNTELNLDNTYTFTQPWATVGGKGLTFSLADFNLATSKGTALVLGNISIDGKTYNVRSANKDFAFDGSAIDMNDPARREVVDFNAGRGVEFAHEDGNSQSCSSCHLQLSFHGGNRTNNTQLCVTCHNPNMTDINTPAMFGTRNGVLSPIDGQYEESADFKRLVHAAHASGAKGKVTRIDPIQIRANLRPGPVAGNSFPGVLSNCQSCHIESKSKDALPGQWTFELTQLPKGQIGSSVITGDWANVTHDRDGVTQHDLSNHMKMTPIASVCSSCHDAGYKTTDGRMNPRILDGGPYVGSHWWEMGGIAPGIVKPGADPKSTKHQSGK